MYTNRSGTQAGKVAIAVQEGENSHDCHAVAISEEDTCCTLKHLLWEISKECFFLLKMGGAIKSKTVEPYIHPCPPDVIHVMTSVLRTFTIFAALLLLY